MGATITEKLINFIRKKGIVRAGDLFTLGIPRTYLSRLVENGRLQRISRGLYAAADYSPSAQRTLAEACRRIPNGVVCLLSALLFHNLTTQLPAKVWIAVDRKARLPKEHFIPLRIVRFSGQALTQGVEIHNAEGVSLKVYGVAKTIADCFKYRNKVGIDVAVEALRDARRKKKCTIDDIWHFARICRVTKVIQPYLEALS